MAKLKHIWYSDLPPEKTINFPPWLKVYDKNCKSVLDYLKANGMSDSSYSTTFKCYSDLRSYLLTSHLIYSLETADEWRSTYHSNTLQIKISLSRLQDIYDYGSIQYLNAYPRQKSCYSQLVDTWKVSISAFQETLNVCESEAISIRRSVSRTLLEFQTLNACSPSDISFQLIDSVCQKENAYHSKRHFPLGWSARFERYLWFLSEKGECSPVMVTVQ